MNAAPDLASPVHLPWKKMGVVQTLRDDVAAVNLRIRPARHPNFGKKKLLGPKNIE